MKNVIREKYNLIPKSQKRLADYFLENIDAIPFLNIYQIAEATQYSVASIVRFAQKLGFQGFSDFKSKITQSYKDSLKNQEIFHPLKIDKVKEHTLVMVANQDIKNINDTLNLIDTKTFDNVVDLILSSKRVYTMGLGISFLLSQILAYQLNQVGVDSYYFRSNSTSFFDQILFLNKDDLLIGFSFPPYSVETVEAAKFAKERKIRVISITNKSSSPITFQCVYSLIVKSENMLFTNSFSAISVIINALATECAKKDRNRAEKFLKEFKYITENFNQVLI